MQNTFAAWMYTSTWTKGNYFFPSGQKLEKTFFFYLNRPLLLMYAQMCAIIKEIMKRKKWLQISSLV